MNVDGIILVPLILDRITRKGASISIQAGSHASPIFLHISFGLWQLGGSQLWVCPTGGIPRSRTLVSCVTSLGKT